MFAAKTSRIRDTIETPRHAWIVWKDGAIESNSHETWNKWCKQPLALIVRDSREFTHKRRRRQVDC